MSRQRRTSLVNFSSSGRLLGSFSGRDSRIYSPIKLLLSCFGMPFHRIPFHRHQNESPSLTGEKLGKKPIEKNKRGRFTSRSTCRFCLLAILLCFPVTAYIIRDVRKISAVLIRRSYKKTKNGVVDDFSANSTVMNQHVDILKNISDGNAKDVLDRRRASLEGVRSFYSLGKADDVRIGEGVSPAIKGKEGALTCDRSHWRSDFCTMNGDIRINPMSSIVWLYSDEKGVKRQQEKVRPYTRKWEIDTCMKQVLEVTLKKVHTPQGAEPNARKIISGHSLRGSQGTSSSRNLLNSEDSVASVETNSGILRSTKSKKKLKAITATNREYREDKKGVNDPILSPRSILKLVEADVDDRGRMLNVQNGTTSVTKERKKVVIWRGLQVDGRLLKWLATWESKELQIMMPEGHNKVKAPLSCDVTHNVPGLVFSTGGYTGNVYHDFNDGLIPLYISTQHYNKEVVFIIADARDWWFVKYYEVLEELSNYPPVLLGQDTRVHCFSDVVVGLHIHNELLVDPALMPQNKSTQNFQNMLDRAWKSSTLRSPARDPCLPPQLTLIQRRGARAITNENMVRKLAKRLGFSVKLLKPDNFTPLQKIWGILQDSAILVGVHGAALTHFLFMRPQTVFIQIVPLGTDWAAWNYYGSPAVSLGLDYLEYKIHVNESTLSKIYPADDPHLTDPDSIVKKGWELMKPIYLEGQNVTLSKHRMLQTLELAKAMLSFEEGIKGHKDKSSARCRQIH